MQPIRPIYSTNNANNNGVKLGQHNITKIPVNTQQANGYQAPLAMGPQPSLQKKGSNPCPAEAEQKSTAFRKLFDEEEDQVMAETSPQFKKI